MPKQLGEQDYVTNIEELLSYPDNVELDFFLHFNQKKLICLLKCYVLFLPPSIANFKYMTFLLTILLK